LALAFATSAVSSDQSVVQGNMALPLRWDADSSHPDLRSEISADGMSVMGTRDWRGVVSNVTFDSGVHECNIKIEESQEAYPDVMVGAIDASSGSLDKARHLTIYSANGYW